MAQITVIIQVPGGPPASLVKHVDDADMNAFLDNLIAERFHGSTRKEAADKFVESMFEDLSLTSANLNRRKTVVKDVFGEDKG